MALFATLNGVRIVSGSILIPSVGMWTADLALATDEPETGAASIVIGNLTLAGTVYRGVPFAGQTRVRVVGGKGGWRTQIQTKGYGNPSGVSLRMVLSDAATECGETVNLATDSTIGPFYARPGLPDPDAPPASFSLRTFCPNWYVDTSGITQIAAWPVVDVGSQFQVIDQSAAEGIVTIATEDYASWLPGASFTSDTLSGTFQCASVVYTFKEDGVFRLEVMTDTAVDRLLAPLHAIIAQRTAPMRFYGRYRYTMSNCSQTTVDIDPIDETIGLPSLQGVPLESDSISAYTPPEGGECRVMFDDGDPTRPVVVWTEGTATVVNILGGSNPVARLGDQVQCFLPPTVPISGTIVEPPYTFDGFIDIANPISGSITQGSGSVNSL